MHSHKHRSGQGHHEHGHGGHHGGHHSHRPNHGAQLADELHVAQRGSAQPGYVRSEQRVPSPTGEGCPKRGGTGECQGDCRTCAYRVS